MPKTTRNSLSGLKKQMDTTSSRKAVDSAALKKPKKTGVSKNSKHAENSAKLRKTVKLSNKVSGASKKPKTTRKESKELKSKLETTQINDTKKPTGYRPAKLTDIDHLIRMIIKNLKTSEIARIRVVSKFFNTQAEAVLKQLAGSGVFVVNAPPVADNYYVHPINPSADYFALSDRARIKPEISLPRVIARYAPNTTQLTLYGFDFDAQQFSRLPLARLEQFALLYSSKSPWFDRTCGDFDFTPLVALRHFTLAKHRPNATLQSMALRQRIHKALPDLRFLVLSGRDTTGQSETVHVSTE